MPMTKYSIKQKICSKFELVSEENKYEPDQVQL